MYIGKPWPYRVAPNDRLVAGDVVYLFAGQSGLYGWGYVTKIERYQDSDLRREMLKVGVSRPVIQEGLVTLAEINQVGVLAGIVERLDGNFAELYPKEVNAFNSLLQSKGTETPPGMAEIQDHFDRLGIRDDSSFAPKLALAIERYNQASILYADLDKFKTVDDTYGHEVGDKVIVAAFRVVQSVIQDIGEDFRPHTAGDEIILLLPNVIDPDAMEIAERIRTAIEQHDFPVIGRGRVTITIGVATYPDTCADWQQLRTTADVTAGQAKKVRRNRVVSCAEKRDAPPHVTDRDLADLQLELQKLDAMTMGRPTNGSEMAKIKLQKIFTIERVVKRLQAEGRPAMAWKLQRQIHAIKMDGRVATDSQRQMDRLIDIEAERNALREEEERKKDDR
ncbi:MAG: GGDEF domain-containing protein [Acidobacteriota bacterium]